MKITLNELRQMVKSLLKEEFYFDSLERLPEMESKIIQMIEEYKDVLKNALSSNDIEFKGFLKNKLSILDKMGDLITSGERFTKDFYDSKNEEYGIKNYIKEFFESERNNEDEEDLIDKLKYFVGSQYVDNIKSFINDIEIFNTAEDAYQGFQDYI
jgi:hypothetical protein